MLLRKNSVVNYYVVMPYLTLVLFATTKCIPPKTAVVNLKNDSVVSLNNANSVYEISAIVNICVECMCNSANNDIQCILNNRSTESNCEIPCPSYS